MRVVDFFSGIGGFSLGLERVGFKTVAFSEVDPYACAVLKKHWPDVPNLGDITKLSAGDVPEADLWCGGFPCQPFSVAGLQRGSKDERNLWPDWFRLIRLVQPRVILMENVPAVLSIERGAVFGGLLRDLASCWYSVEWDCLPASAFGARHHRDRLFIVAHSECQGRERPFTNNSLLESKGEAHAKPLYETPGEWMFMGSGLSPIRVPHGISVGVERERIRLCGNAVVPEVVSWIGQRIKEAEEQA